jgi:formate-dependent nitrite reductase cytochrome c552 subunit
LFLPNNKISDYSLVSVPWRTFMPEKPTSSFEGKKAGPAADRIKEAQTQHLKAHILREFWTAENSDGFHNPDLAGESLTRSVDESRKGTPYSKRP